MKRPALFLHLLVPIALAIDALCLLPARAETNVPHPHPRTAAPKTTTQSPKAWITGPENEALAQIAALAAQPGDASALALEQALHGGLTDRVADAALVALGRHGGPRAQRVLAEFVHHRRPQARLVAYGALAHNFSAATQRETLEHGLGDLDGQVRDHCAHLLVQYGAGSSVPRLQAAFAAGVYSTAAAIGTWSSPDELSAWIHQIGQAPLPAMLQGVDRALGRDDLPADAQIALIETLQSQGTPAISRFLTRVLVGHDWARRPRVRQSLAAALANLPPSEGDAQP